MAFPWRHEDAEEAPLRLLPIALISVLAMAAAPPPQILAIKVTTRLSFPGSDQEQTIFLHGDRERAETRAGGWWARFMAPQRTEIYRCDLARAFYLDNRAREYSSIEYPPRPLTSDEFKARGLDIPEQLSGPRKPTFRIKTTTVDTGERKQAFGRIARHVITTRREIPLEGSKRAWQESVRDGWYIDFDLHLPCVPRRTRAAAHAYLSLSTPGRDTSREIPEFVDHGKLETGFAVDERTSSKLLAVLPGGSKRESRNESRQWVTDLRETAVDPALFEVPANFKHVEPVMPKLTKTSSSTPE